MTASSVTFEDTDATLVFKPFVDGPPSDGWLTTYSGGTTERGNSFAQGIGNSIKTTSTVVATVEFTFYGTSVTLFGEASGSTFSIKLDDAEPQQRTGNADVGILAKLENLTLGEHRVSLQLDIAGPQLSLDRVTFTSEYKGSTVREAISYSENDRWTYSGPWYVTNPRAPMLDTTNGNRAMTSNVKGGKAILSFQGSHDDPPQKLFIFSHCTHITKLEHCSQALVSGKSGPSTKAVPERYLWQ